MMPMGVPTNVASNTMTTEPKIALEIPPTSLGGGVVCVNSATLRPPRPRRMVSRYIHSSQNPLHSMAASVKVKAI